MSDTFTFKSGLTVTLQPVKYTFVAKVRQAALKQAIEKHGEPVIPTYTVTAAGGTEETHEHNEASVSNPPFDVDEETQAKWTAYVDRRRLVDFYVQERTCRAYVDRGVVEGPSDEWLEDQAYWGIDVPDDPRDRKFTWLFDASTGWDEMFELVIAVQELMRSKVEEVAQAVEGSFRDSVEASTEGDDAGSGQEAVDESGEA
jgi:hypothetical protein